MKEGQVIFMKEQEGEPVDVPIVRSDVGIIVCRNVLDRTYTLIGLQ
jgi:hypothetical protein